MDTLISEKTKLVTVPATYKTVSEKILVKPAYTSWKKGRGEIEKVDNSNATYEFMVISGFEREIDKDDSRKGTSEIPSELQIKKLMKAGSQVMINFDFGTRSQANSDLMKNARSYRSMASAVNALANYGWEFVNANVVNLGTTKAHYYYMKRSK